MSVAVHNNALDCMGSLGSTVVGSPLLLAAPRYGGLAVTSGQATALGEKPDCCLLGTVKKISIDLTVLKPKCAYVTFSSF